MSIANSTLLFNVTGIVKSWMRFSPVVPVMVPTVFDHRYWSTIAWSYACKQFTFGSSQQTERDPFHIRYDSDDAVRRILKPAWPSASSLQPIGLHAALLTDVCLAIHGRRSCGWLVRDDGVLFYEAGDPSLSITLL